MAVSIKRKIIIESYVCYDPCLKDPCQDFQVLSLTGGRCRKGFLRAHGDMVKKKFFKKSKKKFSAHTGIAPSNTGVR